MAQPTAVFPLTHIFLHFRIGWLLGAIGEQALALHDWLSDPPMTVRDKDLLFIAETRALRYKRYLLGR